MPISAFDNRLLTGLSFLPASSRGAAASMLRWMALSATTTGAITYEERVTACSGGGGCSVAIAVSRPPSVGNRRSSAHSVAAKKAPTMQAPPSAMRNQRTRANRRIGAVAK